MNSLQSTQPTFSSQSTLAESIVCSSCDYFRTERDTYKLSTIDFKQKAHYWEAQFKQSKEKEDELKQEVEALKAKVLLRERQLFGKKSEKSAGKSEASKPKESEETKRKRGAQCGCKGHGRRDYSHLPVVEEERSLSESEKCCSECGLPYEETGMTEDSKIVELVEVKAHVRHVHRKKYRRTCKCTNSPSIKDASAAPRVLPKTSFGVSIWTHLLTRKYHHQIPLHKILSMLSERGISIAAGTVTDGFQRMIPLLNPVYWAIEKHNVESTHWHADETGWKVFELVSDEKANKRWYLWIFKAEKSVVFKLCPSRSSQVLIDHFGKTHPGGILSVDRYSAYKAIAKEGLFVLAFCWAHVRRDFLTYSKTHPNDEAWGLAWVERISALYHLNHERLRNKPTTAAYRKADKKLRKALEKMHAEANKQLENETLEKQARKLLESLNRHWDGLTVFLDFPDIPMDNNRAENGLRKPVVGRKNYYGCGSIWSSVLLAEMLSIFGTLGLWDINPETWLHVYLQACADAGGKAPDDITKYLPWNMTQEELAFFQKPLPDYDST